MTESIATGASPTPALRPIGRSGTFGAIALVLLMVVSGITAISAQPHYAGLAPTAPLGGAAWLSPMELQSGAQLQSDPMASLAGTPLSSLPNASVVGPAPPSKDLYFTVGFPLQNSTQLSEIISEQGVPGSPLYHKWLTNSQEQVMFGPPKVEVQNTVNYFTSLGFQLATYGTLSVSFRAPVSGVDSAFHTTMSTVRYGSSSSPNTTVANSAPLNLPTPILRGISSVDGLGGPGAFTYYHSQNPLFAQVVAAAEANSLSRAAGPATAPTVYNATMAELYNYTDQATGWFNINYAFGRQLESLKWQTFSAATTTQLFQATPLLSKGYNGNSTGKPINIVIVMEGGINPGDIQAYSQLVWNNPYQLYNRISPDPIDGAYTWNGTLYYTDGASGEMALDIEYSGTMAPGAHITPVYAQGFFPNMLDDQYAAINNMVPTPNIISNSWGGSEDGGTLYSPGIGSDSVMNDYFMLLDAKGASILASSGDGGGFDTTTGILSGSFPASDPNILSVNGLRSDIQDSRGQIFPYDNLTFGNLQTFIPLLNGFQPGLGVNVDFKVTQAATLHNQSYWYVPADNSNLTLYKAPPSASGGFGFSYNFQQPWWQHAVGVPNIGRSLGSGVAAEADFNLSIFFDGVPNFLFGGTSFACPTTAGEIADILDFERASGQGHSAYLGNLNEPVWEIANAYQNGNLSLAPFYSVLNGSSFWGDRGANLQYAWPPGQNFPIGPNGQSDYGDSLPGWNFPNGWGSINVYNFALDLNQLENEKGFDTVNATTNSFATPEWTNLLLNQTYTIDVNATATIAAANPTVTVEYFPQGHTEQKISISGGALTYVPGPANGLRFTLNTGAAPFAPTFSPGLLIFTLGNSTNKNVGFGYDFLNPDIGSGPLTVTVLNPGAGSMVGGCATANVDNPLGGIGGFGLVPGIAQEGLFCVAFSRWSAGGIGVLYSNVFEVQVTNSLGKPVYNAKVTATVPKCVDLAFVCSKAEIQTSYMGRSVGNPYDSINNPIVSVTYTNITGVALVETSNMAYSAPYNVTATYGAEVGTTSYTVVPAPNVNPTGVDAGKYAEFNPLDLLLYVNHGGYSNNTLNQWIPNFTNTSSLYDTLYGWQGQILSLHVTNSTGGSIPDRPVWLGTYDAGAEYKFQRYSPTAGINGITNSSNTVSSTDAFGNVSLTIPDNASATNYFGGLGRAPLGLASVAVSQPGTQNQSFNYQEPCTPINRSNPNLYITCQYNNSFYRNYTATPIWILPNPVNITTMTQARVPRDFFGTGTPVSFQVNVSLPTADPLSIFYFLPNGYNGNSIQWSSGLEHITGANAYVDGHFAQNITPEEPPQLQLWASFVNLTGIYTPGIHYLTVYVNTSMGQTFSFTHEFIVGDIQNENLNQNNLYTPIPYVLNWTINIGASGQAKISNQTFNSSLEITYLGTECPAAGCLVVNFSVRVNPHKVNYNQSINMTLLESKGFYADAPELPTQSDYEVTIWFHANHSGSLRQAVSTNFIFDSLQANITGPTASALVPLGNVTIAYTYQGDYLTNATLFVFQNISATAPPVLVYSQLAFVPAYGGQVRSGSVTWTAVAGGNYWIEIAIGNAFSALKRGEAIQVVNLNPPTTIHKTSGTTPILGLNPLTTATALVLIAAIVGILLGLWVAPSLRPETPVTPSASSPAKAWEEGKEDTKSPAASKNECSICHERFETPAGLLQHQHVVHGVEE